MAGFFGLLLAVPATATLKIVCGHVWRHYVLGEPLDEIEARWEAEDVPVKGGVIERIGDEESATPPRARTTRLRLRRTSSRCRRRLEAERYRRCPARSPHWPSGLGLAARLLRATIARATDVSASSGEAGPTGVGSLMASSAFSTLQPGEGLEELGESVAGGGIVEVDDHVGGDDLADRHGSCSSLALAAGWLVTDHHRPLCVVTLGISLGRTTYAKSS